MFRRQPAHHPVAPATKLADLVIFFRLFRLTRLDRHLRLPAATDAEGDALVEGLRELLA
ncbi:hypothetical protein [Burkholderia cenocepacia]|uniref:hypothetical protein n=1 Tax=Burkholderia cenocepacia TaxID=95486 RepID=UPI00406C43CC